jgi:hypothetical protein
MGEGRATFAARSDFKVALFRLDLAPLPVTMAERITPFARIYHARHKAGHDGG